MLRKEVMQMLRITIKIGKITITIIIKYNNRHSAKK